jgi:anti-sigma factor RsiW
MGRMKDRPYITCQELIGFLHLYLTGELPPERREEFERHLRVCPSCVTYIQTYRDAIALGKATGPELNEPAGQDVPEELVAAILKARRA